MSDQPIFSVSEFVQTIKTHLGRLGTVTVEGEVTGFRKNKDKLIYFELKDATSRMLCFMLTWDLDVELADGMAVRVTGAPSLFQGSGGFHLRVQKVELVGKGALQQALLQLQKKLEAEGLFSPERKRSLPVYPERIGLISSPDAAAWSDVLRILNNRWPLATVVGFPVGVQGRGAVQSIVRVLHTCHRAKVDVVILTRGGGSLEDLQAFNSEDVARAIFKCKVPVVCGVGHERDWTIADLVADVRASTPSNAAERVAPDMVTLKESISNLELGIESSWAQTLGDLDDQLRHLNRDISNVIQNLNQEVKFTWERLVNSWLSAIQQTKSTLEHVTHSIQTLSPLATLERGYSLTVKEGKVIKDAKLVQSGDRLQTRLARGTIRSTAD
jgi:exodeoxyribonuclease VII large subunit